MESHSLPGKIQVSAETKALLEEHYTLESRGTIQVKGKGEMEIWFLEGVEEKVK